jgi:hypothetical protein
LPADDHNTVRGHHGPPRPDHRDACATPDGSDCTATIMRRHAQRAGLRPGRACLPAGPLAAAVRTAGGMSTLLLGQRRTSEGERLARAYYRALERGWITVAAADELACRLLRVHPAAIWGEQFWTGAA